MLLCIPGLPGLVISLPAHSIDTISILRLTSFNKPTPHATSKTAAPLPRFFMLQKTDEFVALYQHAKGRYYGRETGDQP